MPETAQFVYGALGIAYEMTGEFFQTIKYYTQNLAIFFLAEQSCILQAPSVPPVQVPGVCVAEPQNTSWHDPQFSAAAPSINVPGASTARGHTYLAQGTTVVVAALARRTPQCPQLRYTSKAILATAQTVQETAISPRSV